MPRRAVRFRLILPFTIALLLGSAPSVWGREIAIIVSDNHPLTQLSMDELADIYLGQKEVVAGVYLKPIDQSNSQEIKTLFLGKALKRTPPVYQSYWTHRLFVEGGNLPVVKQNSQEVIEAVREKKGAIGYIWASEANGATRIRVILTIKISD